MKRVILLILDGLGIGAMADLEAENRLQDQGTNTLQHILEFNSDLKLPNLSDLGLGKAAGDQRLKTDHLLASYGQAKLKYTGADTFLGHQEIMGSQVKSPKREPFNRVYPRVVNNLKEQGYKVEVVKKPLPYLIVEDLVVVADNIEADYGHIYNVTAPLDFISFSEVVEIGKAVREVVEVSRVIALGGTGITVEDINNNLEVKKEEIIGVNCSRLGVYGADYQVLHLGYDIDYQEQITSILGRAGYDVRLIGKVQDVITCPSAVEKIPKVDTEQVLDLVLSRMQQVTEGLIAANIQEIDLAGHDNNIQEQANILNVVDSYLPEIIDNIEEEDLLLITADHGNDAAAGHAHHTRERTPILMYSPVQEAKFLGSRNNLADIAATIADFFAVNKLKVGTSFLKEG